MSTHPADYFFKQYCGLITRFRSWRWFFVVCAALTSSFILCDALHLLMGLSDQGLALAYFLLLLSWGIFCVCLGLRKLPTRQDVQKHLLLEHSEVKFSPTQPDQPAWDAWNPIFSRRLLSERQRILQSLRLMAGQVIILMFVLAGGFSSSVFRVVSGASGWGEWLLRQPDQMTLTTVRGLVSDPGRARTFALDFETPLSLELSYPNLLEFHYTSESVRLNQAEESSLTMRIQYESSLPDQVLLLTPVSLENERQLRISEFFVQFSVPENAVLWLNSSTSTVPIASVDIQRRPVPEVQLQVLADPSSAWPDDSPLPLKISGSGQNPLKEISLEIRIGDRVTNELVKSLEKAGGPKQFELDHEIFLEPYLQSDQAEVELRAKLKDLATPLAGVGYSNTVVVRTQSAYGRYRDALASLREVKSKIDLSFADNTQVPKQVVSIVDAANKKSQQTPFFDAIDRVRLDQISTGVKKLVQNPSYQGLYAAKEGVDKFLREHEILDDQERDRDFFVAARALSRLIEQPKEKRPISVDKAVHNLEGFLNERAKRWKLRVDFLQQNGQKKAEQLQKVLNEWQKISQRKHFKKYLSQVVDLSKNLNGNQASQAVLSQLMADYEKWTDLLEAGEESFRQSLEKKRQEGVASASNKLRELQVAQGKISSALDKAAEKDRGKLQAAWPALRMKQNSIIGEAKQVEYSLRVLMPFAADRVKFAVESMQQVLQFGEKSIFAAAESGSDLAGRLLRHANDASQRSMRQSGRRRRRRISGDQYYGQSVHGGNLSLERDYQVDKMYRENVLDSIERAKRENPQQAKFLDRYLRELIR